MESPGRTSNGLASFLRPFRSVHGQKQDFLGEMHVPRKGLYCCCHANVVLLTLEPHFCPNSPFPSTFFFLLCSHLLSHPLIQSVLGGLNPFQGLRFLPDSLFQRSSASDFVSTHPHVGTPLSAQSIPIHSLSVPFPFLPLPTHTLKLTPCR